MAWTQQGSLKGPKGDTGSTGAKGDTGAAGTPGTPGTNGTNGTNGVDGASVSIAGQVATYANLPTGLANTNADRGKGYLVDADGLLYVWTGTAFPSNGNGVEFRGPQGIKGDTGSAGAAGTPGTPGTNGTNGSNGARGATWFTGAGAPSGVSGSVAGDFYLDTQTGAYYQLS
jgi:hypothetical protein